jgi:NTE family protein
LQEQDVGDISMHHSKFTTFLTTTAIIFVFIAYPVFSQSVEIKATKIGLVLSGGGARGFAHIGVLKVLEEVGIKVDLITGTSMGSIVGGFYAIGYDAKTIERLVLEQNWNKLLNDDISRLDISMSEKKESSKYVGSFPIYEHGVNLPSGLLAGQNISMLLSRLSWPVHHVQNFDEFYIPFRCVATDIVTGEAVVLKSGYLPDVIRASMAIPSVFTPVEIDGRLLVDGGLVMNFPVEEALSMGADIIIGVDVGTPLQPREKLRSFADIMLQALNFQSAIVTEEQASKCNILIKPDLAGYTIADFNSADSLIALGESAARKMLPELQALADSVAQKEESGGRFIPATSIARIHIEKIDIEGLQHVSKDLVLGKLQIDAPCDLAIEELEQAIQRVYGSQFFERVNYQLEPLNNSMSLIVRVIESTSSKINFGLNYSADHDAGILLNGTARNLIGNGTKLSVDARLGKNMEYGLSYFYYSNFRPGFGFGLSTKEQRYDQKVYADFEPVASFRFVNAQTTMHIQPIITNTVLLDFQAQYQITRRLPSILPYDWYRDKVQTSYLNLIARFEADALNDLYFPTYGTAFTAEFKRMHPRHSNGGEAGPSFYRLFMNYDKAVSRSALTLCFGASAGYLSRNDIAIDQFYFIGGINTFEPYMLPFVGFKYMQVWVQNYLIGKMNLQWEIMPNNFIILNVNALQSNDDYQKLLHVSDAVYGYGITYGIATPIGPFKWTFSSNSKTNDFYSDLSIGFWF